MKMLTNEKSGSPPQASRSTESNAALAVARSCPSFSASVDEDGVNRYALDNFTRILYHIPAQKVAEKGKENGDDTHPQARKNLVIQL